MNDPRPSATKKDEDKAIEKELKDTFPASDPLSTTQPGGGITGAEPPPKGPSERAEKTGGASPNKGSGI